jgi:hypothetical protein
MFCRCTMCCTRTMSSTRTMYCPCPVLYIHNVLYARNVLYTHNVLYMHNVLSMHIVHCALHNVLHVPSDEHYCGECIDGAKNQCIPWCIVSVSLVQKYVWETLSGPSASYMVLGGRSVRPPPAATPGPRLAPPPPPLPRSRRSPAPTGEPCPCGAGAARRPACLGTAPPFAHNMLIWRNRSTSPGRCCLRRAGTAGGE